MKKTITDLIEALKIRLLLHRYPLLIYYQRITKEQLLKEKKLTYSVPPSYINTLPKMTYKSLVSSGAGRDVNRFLKNANIPPSQIKDILDIGSGLGDYYTLFKHYFPTAKYTGIEITDQLLSLSRHRYPSANFVKGSLLVPNTINKPNQLIFISGVLHYMVSDLDMAMQHLKNNAQKYLLITRMPIIKHHRSNQIFIRQKIYTQSQTDINHIIVKKPNYFIDKLKPKFSLITSDCLSEVYKLQNDNCEPLIHNIMLFRRK